MVFSDACALLLRAMELSALPGAYLFCGSSGETRRLSLFMAQSLFPAAKELAADFGHPDTALVVPAGKRREITVDQVREGIVEKLASSAYSGGWRLVVVSEADRMNQQASNALLKSLEEPPPKTLFILETEAPDSILPTILSRVQKIYLPFSGIEGEGTVRDEIEEALAEPATTFAGRMRLGRRLAEILEAAEEDEDGAGNADKRFFEALLAAVRRSLEDGSVERYKAFRRIEAVEAAARQCGRSMNKEAVLCRMADRL